jgi:cellulase/cellobiase CelA1
MQKEDLMRRYNTGAITIKKVKTQDGIKFDMQTLETCPNFAEFMRDVCGISLSGWQNEAATAFLAVVKEEQEKSGCGFARGKTMVAQGLLNFINEHGNNFRL